MSITTIFESLSSPASTRTDTLLFESSFRLYVQHTCDVHLDCCLINRSFLQVRLTNTRCIHSVSSLHAPFGTLARPSHAEIREALRWATDDALILYARANLLADAEMRASAATTNVENVRFPTVLSSASKAAEELRRLKNAVVGANEESMAIDELPASVPNQVISNSIQVTTTAATRLHAIDTQAVTSGASGG